MIKFAQMLAFLSVKKLAEWYDIHFENRAHVKGISA